VPSVSGDEIGRVISGSLHSEGLLVHLAANSSSTSTLTNSKIKIIQRHQIHHHDKYIDSTLPLLSSKDSTLILSIPFHFRNTSTQFAMATKGGQHFTPQVRDTRAGPNIHTYIPRADGGIVIGGVAYYPDGPKPIVTAIPASLPVPVTASAAQPTMVHQPIPPSLAYRHVFIPAPFHAENMCNTSVPTSSPFDSRNQSHASPLFLTSSPHISNLQLFTMYLLTTSSPR
jgi:hypothetical protein